MVTFQKIGTHAYRFTSHGCLGDEIINGTGTVRRVARCQWVAQFPRQDAHKARTRTGAVAWAVRDRWHW